MRSKLIEGVYTAAATNRTANGDFDPESFHRSLIGLNQRGINGFALGGATGEYCLLSPEEFKQMMQVVGTVSAAGIACIVGIGSPDLRRCIHMAEQAADAGAKAVLLPAPYFFPYGQEDLQTFFIEAGRQSPLPVLLYNLPQFTSPIEVATLLRVMEHCPNIIGIKDSSGSLQTLEALTRERPEACRIVGNDSALGPALQGSVCDGVISGVAYVLPELIQKVFANPEAASLTRLREFISEIQNFPVPWALKILAEYQGNAKAYFAQPFSDSREREKERLLHWFAGWNRS